MVKVNLWSGMTRYTDGAQVIDIEAKNVGEVLRGLVRAHPELEPMLEAGVSVAVDGKVIASSLTAPVNEDSEVYLIEQLKGG